MAIQQYGSGPYNPNSTANNQNTAAYRNPTSWQPTSTNMPTNNGNNSQYNPWGTGGTARSSAQGGPQTYTPSTMTPWNQTTPTAPAPTPGQQSTPQQWPTPQAWTPANFNTPALQTQNSAYMSTVLPYLQYQQNNSQYSQDFNEAQRRWDAQNGWQQQMDQYNMGLTGRQQTFNEWQAQEAANQWGAQFGWTQQNDLFSQGLATQQQAIDRAYNEGRLSNEQRQIALAELTQQQQMGWNREELASRDALARWQQEQQMQMQQAELAAARQNAVLQATGRAQGNGPSAVWMKRF